MTKKTSRKQILKYTGIGLLVLIILVLILLPGQVKKYAVEHSKDLVGRKMDIRKLKVNYFTGTVRVYDFKMYEANETDVFVAFDTLILNTKPLKFISNMYAVEQFYVEGLDLKIIRQDSTFNYDDLLAFHTTVDTTAVQEESEEAFKYLLQNLEVKHANVSFYDATVDHISELEDFSLFIPEIAWDQESESDADVEFTLGEAEVEIVSNVHPKTNNYTSTIDINNLQLNAFKNYVLDYANINAIEGTVHAVVNLDGNISKPLETFISGEVEVLKPYMMDTNDVTFLSVEKVLGTIAKVDYSNSSYVIDDLVLEEPFVKFELDSISNNIFRIFNYPPEPGESEEGESSLYYALNHVEVNNGRLDYTDNLTGQNFDYGLSAIEIDTDSIRSDSDWVDVYATMLLNERGKAKAEVGYNPQNPMYASIDVSVEDFLLSDLNIYSGYYTGHSVLKGDMIYFFKMDITDGAIENENNLLIRDVSVENIKGGLYAIPLKMAIWLLKDREGNIELDVPVRGNLNDPEVDTWALVKNTLRKKIFNTTENPVKPLARFIDADPEDLEGFAINYPDTILTAEQMRRMDLVLQLEREKEGLEAEMNFMGLDSLQVQLANAYATEKFVKQRENSGANTSFKTFINSEIGIDSLSLEASLKKYGELIQADSLATNYMRFMISKVDAYLKLKEPSTEIKVQKAKVSDKDNLGAVPGFKMNYSLKEEQEE